MNTKNAIMTTTLSVITVLAITSITGLNNAFAEESSEYKMSDDIHAIFTFTFKDGVEIHEFPVFNMEDDFVENIGSPSFSVQGVVGDGPHLHKALDEAFKYKQNSSYEWNYQLFEVDVDFIKNGDTIRTISYHDCLVDDYKVETLTDDYESYMSSSSGFAIIDYIDFLCGGINPITESTNITWQTEYTTTKYPQTSYKFAEDVRTFITFEFDQGIEKIEFPYFELTSGFEEEDDNVVPGFAVEGTISAHPLLNKAIDDARKVSGYGTGSNLDFEATVEFTKGDDVLRTLEYKDCRVSGAKMITQSDKEEGFTGKSGFALVETIDFECIGLTTLNDTYDELRSGAPVWDITKIENVVQSHEYPLGTGPRAIATFTFDDGVEVIDFPIFDQGEVLVKANPSFELEGLVGDYPMLYNRVDDNLSLTSTTGANNFIDLFNVDVDLVYDDKVVRGFNYVDCRVTDYVVHTQRDKEESYFKGFALSNTFNFVCQGYHPNNPVYDAMFNTYAKADTTSTNDLRNTDTWKPGFYVK
jgi:hypothetical protein